MTGTGQARARLLAMASDGHPRSAIALGLDLLVAGAPFERVIVDVLAPVQRQVGKLWEADLWSIADEHAATAVVDGVLGALALEAPVPDCPRGEVLVACAEGEHHTLPARMGVELLRADGWGVTFLGGSLPAADLQRFAAQHEPDVVVISCTVPLFLPGARRCFEAVGEVGLPALGAGAAFGTDPRRSLRLGACGWLGPGGDLATVLESLEPEPSPSPIPPEALALELDREALGAQCLTNMAARVPVLAGYSAAQLRSTSADIDDVLRFLGIAIDIAEDEIFDTFVAWLSGVRRSRGIPAHVLDTSLQVMVEVLRGAGSAEAARLCALGRASLTSVPLPAKVAREGPLR